MARDPLHQADLAMGITWAPRRGAAAVPASPPVDAEAGRVAAKPIETGGTGTPASRAPRTEALEATASEQAATTALTMPARLPTQGQSRVLASRAERDEALRELRERHERQCPHCTTATGHTQTVFGEGDSMARLVFVGEAPGETEDRTGRPFVGRAGEKLDEMIRAMGLGREQVYIANVLKSRPPDNRTPLQHEVNGCGPYLIEQLLVIRPQVIVTLGGPASKLLLGTDTGITRHRGAWAQWNPPEGLGQPIAVMPTYHPAYLLRNYTAKTRAEVWSDLQAVMQRLGLSPARK